MYEYLTKITIIYDIMQQYKLMFSSKLKNTLGLTLQDMGKHFGELNLLQWR